MCPVYTRVSGDYAYVLTRDWDILDDTFCIIKINPIETAYVVSEIPWPSYGGVNFEVKDGYAFIPGGNKGFYIVDIDPPENPEIVQIVPSDNSGYEVAFDGQYAYVAGTYATMVVDIDPPESAAKVAEFAAGGTYIAIKDGYAYMPYYYEGLHVYKLY